MATQKNALPATQPCMAPLVHGMTTGVPSERWYTASRSVA